MQCPTCLVEFDPRRRSHRYCSRKCRDADRSHPSVEWRPCKVCGVPFEWVSSHPSRNRCDLHLDHRKRSGVVGGPATSESRPCELCGVPFVWVSSRPTQRFCSKRHQERMQQRRKSARRRSRDSGKPVVHVATSESRPCELCGVPFVWVSSRPTQRFCSKRCLWAHKSRKASRRQRRENHRARARFYGVAYVPIQPRVIYARDRWRCGVCGDPVDRLRRWPDPLSASLDHVVPMSLGGDHLPANVQCSHLACNAGHGDTPERVVLDAGTLVVD